jgi:predicted MFS family arabinose efflux permease
VPDLVPRSRLHTANGRVMAAQHVAGSFLGGPIGGVVVGIGAAWAFGLPAGLAIGAALVLAVGVPGRYRHAARPGDGRASDAPAARTGLPAAAAREVRRTLAEVREGVSFLVRSPVLRPLLITGSVSNMCFTGYTAVFVLWAVGEGSAIGLTPTQYPLIGVAMAVGAVLGSVVVEPLHRVVGEVRLMLGSWLTMSVLLVVPVLWPTALATGIAFFLVGLLTTLGNVLSQSMRQRLVAPSMLGRVGGAGRTLAYGLMPVGALLAGVAAEAWGLRVTLWGAAAVAVVAMVYPLLVVRQRHVAAAEAAVPA